MRLRNTLIALAMTPLAAQSAEPTTYLCLADQVTGFKFDEAAKAWKETSFNAGNARYIIKLDADKVYRLYMFGQPQDPKKANATCEAGFNEGGVLWCDGFSRFAFSAKNGRFTATEMMGYILADSIGKEGMFTPFLSIGKCSPI